jgi:hypothetical protein
MVSSKHDSPRRFFSRFKPNENHAQTKTGGPPFEHGHSALPAGRNLFTPTAGNACTCGKAGNMPKTGANAAVSAESIILPE